MLGTQWALVDETGGRGRRIGKFFRRRWFHVGGLRGANVTALADDVVVETVVVVRLIVFGITIIRIRQKLDAMDTLQFRLDFLPYRCYGMQRLAIGSHRCPCYSSKEKAPLNEGLFVSRPG